MNNDILIKKLEREEFNDFFNMICELAKFEGDIPPDDNAKQRLITDAFTDTPKYEPYLIFNIDKKIVGYLIIYMTYSSYEAKQTLYIEDIYIKPEYRRNGFGKNVFDYCIDLAKKRKSGRVDWTAVSSNNKAVDFYINKIGATEVDYKYFRIKL